MTESENENDHFDLDHFDHSLSYKLFFPMRPRTILISSAVS